MAEVEVDTGKLCLFGDLREGDVCCFEGEHEVDDGGYDFSTAYLIKTFNYSYEDGNSYNAIDLEDGSFWVLDPDEEVTLYRKVVLS